MYGMLLESVQHFVQVRNGAEMRVLICILFADEYLRLCGISGEGVSIRIIGGKVTLPHIFPWIVAILYKDSLHCGGSLINDRYVLTAGHCVKWTVLEDLSVIVGVHDIENPYEGRMIPIESIILHDLFESNYMRDINDIALIKLKYPVRFSKDVQPVCLPRKDVGYTGRRAKVAGWGRVLNNGEASRYLREATLKVMSWPSCKNTSFGSHVTKSMICAYKDNTDACQGDSGGPLMLQKPDAGYEIIGIVSWGIGCANKDIPGVYVKSVDYLKWIYNNTKDSSYCVSR